VPIRDIALSSREIRCSYLCGFIACFSRNDGRPSDGSERNSALIIYDDHVIASTIELESEGVERMERRVPPKTIQDVSETALMVAIWRAAENTHANPLYRDPLALKLAGDRGREIIKGLPKGRTSIGHWMMAIRTRVIDDLIREAVADGVDLVLNLGAGLDTRPYRLELPSNLCWVEVDCAKIIELKESCLFEEKPACRLKRLSCDLADTWSRQALLASAAQKGRNALVLTEGVIPYLSEEDVGALASDLKKYPCFRYWVADYFSPTIKKYRQAQSKKMLENAPFKFAPGDYFSFFVSHGWHAKDVRYIVDAAQMLGRPAPRWVRIMFALRGLFLTPEQRDQRKNSMAYVLFEPCPNNDPGG
jgi:methyltransferase (TIGR00027 family)